MKNKKVLIIIGAIAIVAFGALFFANKKAEEDTLVVWAMGAEGEALGEFSKQYTEETGVKVEVVPIPWDQAHDKLLTAVAAQEGPDVIQLGTSWIPEFAEAGALADMSPYIEQYPNMQPENFYSASQETMAYGGTTVAVPWYVDTRVLFYRTDTLASVGYPEGPQTWEELLDASRKLTARGEGNYGISLDTADQFFTITYAWQNGWEVFDEEGNLNLDDPKYIEAVEYLNTFFAEGLTPYKMDLDLMATFADGTVPMFVSGPWMINEIQNNTELTDDQWAVKVLPSGPESNVSFAGGSNLVIFEWSDKKDEAAAYINWLMDDTTQIAWYQTTNCLPSKMSAWNDPILADDENMMVFQQQLETAKAQPFIPEWEPIAKAINDALEPLWMQQTTVQEAVKTAQTEAEKLLE